jgi:predicted flap endonuclease-1-like 5' DNA nuclease
MENIPESSSLTFENWLSDQTNQSLYLFIYRKIFEMFENITETIVLLVSGSVLGFLISLLYWRGKVNEREDRIEALEASLNDNEAEMNEFRTRAQQLMNQRGKQIENLNNRVKDYENIVEERDKGINRLNTLIGQRDRNIRELNQQISEKNRSIDSIQNNVTELESQVENLSTQLNQKDENILRLTQQVTEKDSSINIMKNDVADLEKKNRDSEYRAETTEAKVVELEKVSEENENEITSLKARMRVMQDDFTFIVGIGPKVSSVLRSAGITTFEKLSSTEVIRIREILEAENPNLLRLVNPETWPEQARKAIEGDWEALSTQ